MHPFPEEPVRAASLPQGPLPSTAGGWLGPLLRTGLGALLGVLAAVLFLGSVDREYEASATIKLGIFDGQPVEGAAASSQRLRSRPLQDRVVARTGLDPDTALMFRESVRASQVRGADLIELRLRGPSPETAGRLLNAAVEELAEAHAALSADSLARLRGEAAKLRAELEANSQARQRLAQTERIGESGRPGDRFSERVVLGSVAALRDQHAERLLTRLSDLDERLTPTKTHPTRLLEAPWVPERPAFPRPGTTIAVGLVAGLLAGALWQAAAGIARRRPAGLAR